MRPISLSLWRMPLMPITNPKHRIAGPTWVRVLLLACMLWSFTGCYHKDVMTDRADDVAGNFLYQGPEGNFIISKEDIFQANSKSSGGGMTHISGYSEMRLSSYRIATGELAGRVELGEKMEEANALLGYSPGKIWMFSIVPELGLHYRDPITLEVKETWEQISKKPGWADFKPAKPDWPIIDQYFTFDWEQNRLLLTDEAGYRYAVDPNSFQIQKVDAELPRLDWEENITNSSGEFKKDDRLYLEGDPRKVISSFGKKTGQDVSFLFGNWIMDHSFALAGERKRAQLADLENAIQAANDSLKALSARHPEANQARDWSNWSYEQREWNRQGEDYRRAVEALQRDLVQASRPTEEALDYPLLTGDHKSAYILHTNVVSDTSHAIVSRVDLHPDSTWTIAWTTPLAGIFFDHSKADQAGAFETVYSKGNPEFDYEWSCTDGQYLVLILQLHMLALDLKTGKLVWNIEI